MEMIVVVVVVIQSFEIFSIIALIFVDVKFTLIPPLSHIIVTAQFYPPLHPCFVLPSEKKTFISRKKCTNY